MCQSGALGVLQAPEGCWERQEPWSQTLHVSAFEKHDSLKALWVQIHHGASGFAGHTYVSVFLKRFTPHKGVLSDFC